MRKRDQKRNVKSTFRARRLKSSDFVELQARRSSSLPAVARARADARLGQRAPAMAAVPAQPAVSTPTPFTPHTPKQPDHPKQQHPKQQTPWSWSSSWSPSWYGGSGPWSGSAPLAPPTGHEVGKEPTGHEVGKEPWIVALLRSVWGQSAMGSELLVRIRDEFALLLCISEGETTIPSDAGWPEMTFTPQRRQPSCSPPCLPKMHSNTHPPSAKVSGGGGGGGGGHNSGGESGGKCGGESGGGGARSAPRARIVGSHPHRSPFRRAASIPTHPLVIDGVPMDPSSTANPECGRCSLSLRQRTATFSPLARKAMMQMATQTVLAQR